MDCHLLPLAIDRAIMLRSELERAEEAFSDDDDDISRFRSGSSCISSSRSTLNRLNMCDSVKGFAFRQLGSRQGIIARPGIHS